MRRHSDPPWKPYMGLFNEAVAFAEFSLANEGAGLLTMRKRSTMVEVFGLLGEEINEARSENRGVDPFIVQFYVQQIIDRASFPEGDQPPIYYDDMPDPPEDLDLHVFSYQPRPSRRQIRESNDHEIAFVVGEVVGRFDLNTHASDDNKPNMPFRKPSAVEVVAAALRRATSGQIGSVSAVRARLTPETKADFAEGVEEGQAQKPKSKDDPSDLG